jgi:hypothetical protein
VWAVLSDGYRYADWVQGTKEIRDVDAGWPAVGTSIHYTVGVAFVTHKDETVVRTSEPERRLELEVQAWPLGTARVDIRIEPYGNDGSRVTLDEHPLLGIAGWLHNPLTALGFSVRTWVMIDELLKLAEAHHLG